MMDKPSPVNLMAPEQARAALAKAGAWMARAEDGIRVNRIVFMMSRAEVAMLDKWQHAKRIATRAEAIRRLIMSGVIQFETREELVARLLELEPEDAAREAAGHPLVRGIDFLPAIVIHFSDETLLAFEAGK